MNTHPQKRMLTFGEFIASVYEASGKRRGVGIVQLAITSHLVEFRGQARFVISEQLQTLRKMGAFEKNSPCRAES